MNSLSNEKGLVHSLVTKCFAFLRFIIVAFKNEEGLHLDTCHMMRVASSNSFYFFFNKIIFFSFGKGY